MSALDLHLAMTTLARARPVFQSEADFHVDLRTGQARLERQ